MAVVNRHAKWFLFNLLLCLFRGSPSTPMERLTDLNPDEK